MNILIHILLLLPVVTHAIPLLKLSELAYKPVTFTVFDEAGQPVENADVTLSDPRPGDLNGQTDDEGVLVTDVAANASLSIFVSKDGYYTTGGRIWENATVRGPDGEWMHTEIPDSFEIILKEIRDPRDLVHRMFRGNAPKADKPVGFDLLVGDWMAPYGTGKYPDFLFHFQGTVADFENFSGTMTLSFANTGDGIQAFQAVSPASHFYRSDLAPPQNAPTEGYDPALSYTLSHKKREPWLTYHQPDRNYLFRTRTVMDAEGKIRQACYGWILGEIEFDPRDPKGPQLVFQYFFNADPDPHQRSLESSLYLPKTQ